MKLWITVLNHGDEPTDEDMLDVEQTVDLYRVRNSTMRVELIGHFKPCVTDIYLHFIDCRCAHERLYRSQRPRPWSGSVETNGPARTRT